MYIVFYPNSKHAGALLETEAWLCAALATSWSTDNRQKMNRLF